MSSRFSSHLRLLGLGLCVAAYTGCAIISTPRGGLADKAGPVLDTAASTPNFQLNFYPKEIVLEFDEYVVLKNASRDIVLTPTPVSGRPEFEQRGKTVIVNFDEVELRDSTTYQIQFGNTIQDLNEGNSAQSLRYVFSTGSYLDSLELRGKVEDAFDGKAVAGALVGMYLGTADTVLAKAAPDYFTKTDSLGNFSLDYLSPGRYQLAAYLDENSNFRLNEGSEKIGFLDTTVLVVAGALDSVYLLRLSAETAPLRVLRAEQLYPGYVRFTLNQPAFPELEVLGLPGEVLARFEIADSLFVAYTPVLDTLPELLLKAGPYVDTARFRKTLTALPTRIRQDDGNGPAAGLAAQRFTFNVPIKTFNLDSIEVTVDSLPVGKGIFELSATDPRELVWRYPSDTLGTYELRFLPGALRGAAAEQLQDTIVLNVRPRKDKDFGQLTLIFDSLAVGKSYVAELVDASGKLERRLIIPTDRASPTKFETVIRRLNPGNYSLRLIDDTDQNERFSVGNRRLNRQPERITTFAIDQIRADWTVEQRIIVNP